jgi:Rod binding domain-containing protein
MQINTNTLNGAAASDALSASELKGLESLAASGEEAEAAQAFESLFASMLVKEMRSSIDGGFFGKGPGADTYGQWFDKEMGAAIAADNGLGLAGVLKAQLGAERRASEVPE